MNTNEFFYPFDPTGKATTNLVSGERQVVNSPGIMNFFYIVPKAGPFFRDGLKVKLYPSGIELVEGVDYNPTHYFHAGSHGTGLQMYGSLTFYDHTLTGTVSLEYQTIGGDWVLDEGKIVELLANNLIDPRITTWDEAIDLPYQFPAIDHEFNVDDFIGMEEVVSGLTRIKEAIIAASSGASAGHVLDHENPHQVTATQVGLGLVQNYAMASLTQAQQGTSTNTYMTPQRTAQAIQAMAWNRIDAHVMDLDNPHVVTKAHVGLGNVENYIIASTLEAETGSVNIRYMSPIRTKEAITKLALLPLNTFIARRDNPNVVTAAQVGLGNVSDFATGTSADAIEGLSPNKFLVVREIVVAIKAHAGDKIDAHIADTNNPHAVNKDDVGLGSVQNYPIADGSDIIAGTSNVAYTTPAAVRQMIALFGESGGGGGVSIHETLTDNPHNVTATQVGLGNVQNYGIASTEIAEAGTSTTTYMTPLLTMQSIQANVLPLLSEHTTAFDNPHAVTALQVGLGNVQNYGIASTEIAEAGVSNITYMTPLLTKQAIQAGVVVLLDTHTGDLNNPHGVTATHIGLNNVQNYPIATTEIAEAGVSNTAYMTPLLTNQLIQASVVVTLDAHTADLNNPHGVTAAQIGTHTATYIDDGLATKLDLTADAVNALKVYGLDQTSLYTDIATNVTANNANRLGGKTVSEIVALASSSGVASDSLLLGGQTADLILQEFIGSGRAGANHTALPPLVKMFDFAAPEVPIIPDESWTKIGSWKPSLADSTKLSSLSFFIEGGGIDDTVGVPLALCTMEIDRAVWVDTGEPTFTSITRSMLTPNEPGYELYIAASYGGLIPTLSYDIWMKNARLRESLNITDLTGRYITWNKGAPVTDIAEAVLTHSLTLTPFANFGSAINADTLIGAFASVTDKLNSL